LKAQADAYADGKITAEEQARINQAQANLQASKAYADAQDNLTKVETKAYADGVVDAEEQRAIADAQAKLNEAKNHADQQANQAQANAIAASSANIAAAMAALSIGGRNMLLKSDDIKYIASEGTMLWPLSSRVKGDIVIQLWCENTVENGTGLMFRTEDTWDQTFIATPTLKNGLNTILIKDVDSTTNTQLGLYCNNTTKVVRAKLEIGNLATDWTPAPEDLQAQITESVAASKAYADAQDNLKETQTKAYADGKITDAEARAIADATAKANAAKAYADAQDVLLKAQADAYADGK
ncbi:hypothetical protein, partial [Sphingobacterium multivorum]|uniref:hypothetical protein n=1 Tax=Sphingobacterium multivorum TaxID=28454 RepID=UPI003DA55B1B